MPKPYRLIFAGTPDFAVPALDALHAAGHEIAAVFTQPDRPAGRGRQLTAPPVKRRAQTFDLPIYQPETLKDPAVQDQLRALVPDIMVVVAYGLLLPSAVLAIPKYGCLNIHASLLPRWRGAAPIQRAIEAGDATTGVSIMQMEAGLDTGPVLLQKTIPITETATSASLHDTLATLGGNAIVEALARLPELTPQLQDDKQATHAAKLSKAEARLDWRKPAAQLAREVRAFNPWPVSFTYLSGQPNQPVRVWAASSADVQAPASAPPGSVVNSNPQGIDVAAGNQSVIALTRLQRAGGKPVSAAEFLQAKSLTPGQQFL
ncbi:MAG TPA: methionyl-tRNA formyltransferase [Gammaproteobacteria bacterium]|nr:methionyl-tRNA formyltransferase [Gammaproteobacteria bacterium]